MKKIKEKSSNCVGWKHLSLEERQAVYVMLGQGYEIQEISLRLKRSESTIRRELRRNRSRNPYVLGSDVYTQAKNAHDRAKARQHQSKTRQRLKSKFIRDYVESKLKIGWTPELISGRLELDHPGYQISHQAIYDWIHEERKDLKQCLPVVGTRKRRCRGSKRGMRKQRNPAAPKRSIEKRPKKVDSRQEFGHWEADTVVSRQGASCVYSMIERKSRFTLFDKLYACNSENVLLSAKRLLAHLPASMRKTLTQDNGPENAKFEKIEEQLKMTTYFCHPYSAWERGSVENVHRFIRRVFPKKTNFDQVALYEIKAIQDFVNNRPRKVLGFRTAQEVFDQELKKINSS